ncbi:MAG: hypothetical protein AAB497_02805 [Patescibacteria group bacterium]
MKDNFNSPNKKSLQRSASGAFTAVDYEPKYPQDKGETTIVSIERYRTILSDNTSTDEQIVKRLRYLEALCRNVIKSEIKSYVEGKKK